jgi:hypothetical protein
MIGLFHSFGSKRKARAGSDGPALDTNGWNGQNYGHHDAEATLHPDLRARGDATSEVHRRKVRQPDPREDRGAVAVRAERRNEEPQAAAQPAPFAAEWEIRFGPHSRFRVLYDIDNENRTVQIVAIGEKEGNRLIVGGEEVEL